MSVKASINKFNDAMDAMSRRDARLIQTFSYYDKPDRSPPSQDFLDLVEQGSARAEPCALFLEQAEFYRVLG